MKNLLLFNYNIEVSDLKEEKDGNYSFYNDYDKYYFINFQGVKKDIELIYKMLMSMINKFHYIILNKFNNIFTEYEKRDYILIKVNGPENIEVDMLDILRDNITIKEGEYSPLLRTNWGNLWENKVDYLEYQVSELGKNHKIVTKSFSYYVGLAENAIEYFNMLKIESVPLSISRKRIKFPNTIGDYYNPLNIIIDYRVRDIASYIKSLFFECQDTNNEINILLEKNLLSPLEYNLLFVRLLYPDYYFDDFQRVVEKSESDDILLKYIVLVDDYEQFLRNLYTKLSKKCSLLKIDWLLKK